MTFGVLGWCAEILWTGIGSLAAGDPALTAHVSAAQAVLPPLAAHRRVYLYHLYGGISDGVSAAEPDRGLPLGLWGQVLFRDGLYPFGLCTPLGGNGDVF